VQRMRLRRIVDLVIKPLASALTELRLRPKLCCTEWPKGGKSLVASLIAHNSSAVCARIMLVGVKGIQCSRKGELIYPKRVEEITGPAVARRTALSLRP